MNNTSRDYSEKRDFIRMQISTNCEIQYKGQEYKANCLDLSSKGALIESEQAFEVDSSVTLKINSGGGDTPPLIAEASILRIVKSNSGQYQYGVSINQYF